VEPSRRKSTEKIDGIVAQAMAMGRLMAREGEGEIESAIF
jgi:hypothetical protein